MKWWTRIAGIINRSSWNASQRINFPIRWQLFFCFTLIFVHFAERIMYYQANPIFCSNSLESHNFMSILWTTTLIFKCIPIKLQQKKTRHTSIKTRNFYFHSHFSFVCVKRKGWSQTHLWYTFPFDLRKIVTNNMKMGIIVTTLLDNIDIFFVLSCYVIVIKLVKFRFYLFAQILEVKWACILFTCPEHPFFQAFFLADYTDFITHSTEKRILEKERKKESMRRRRNGGGRNTRESSWEKTKFGLRRRKQTETMKEFKTTFIILLLLFLCVVTIFFHPSTKDIKIHTSHSLQYNLPFIYFFSLFIAVSLSMPFSAFDFVFKMYILYRFSMFRSFFTGR